jgi:thioredoxin-like negative regulator of GroEL
MRAPPLFFFFLLLLFAPPNPVSCYPSHLLVSPIHEHVKKAAAGGEGESGGPGEAQHVSLIEAYRRVSRGASDHFEDGSDASGGHDHSHEPAGASNDREAAMDGALDADFPDYSSVSRAAKAHADAPDGHLFRVHEGTTANFDALLSLSEFAIVFFYAPWSTACQRLIPVIDGLPAAFEEEDIRVTIIAVDVTDSTSLQYRYDALGFPHIRLFRRGLPYYRQNWSTKTTKGLAEWVKVMYRPPVLHFDPPFPEGLSAWFRKPMRNDGQDLGPEYWEKAKEVAARRRAGEDVRLEEQYESTVVFEPPPWFDLWNPSRRTYANVLIGFFHRGERGKSELHEEFHALSEELEFQNSAVWLETEAAADDAERVILYQRQSELFVLPPLANNTCSSGHELRHFLEDRVLPLLQPLPLASRRIAARGLPVAMVFVDGAKPRAEYPLLDEQLRGVEAAAVQLRGRVSFAQYNVREQGVEQLIAAGFPADVRLPVLAFTRHTDILIDGAGHESEIFHRYAFDGNLADEAEVRRFVDDAVLGVLPALHRSAPRPAENPVPTTGTYIVTRDTFDELILTPGWQTILLMVYSPRCPWSLKFAPEWRRVSARLAERRQFDEDTVAAGGEAPTAPPIVLAKMDGVANDVPFRHRGLPSLHLFLSLADDEETYLSLDLRRTANSSFAYNGFRGPRTADNILDFLDTFNSMPPPRRRALAALHASFPAIDLGILLQTLDAYGAGDLERSRAYLRSLKDHERRTGHRHREWLERRLAAEIEEDEMFDAGIVDPHHETMHTDSWAEHRAHAIALAVDRTGDDHTSVDTAQHFADEPSAVFAARVRRESWSRLARITMHNFPVFARTSSAQFLLFEHSHCVECLRWVDLVLEKSQSDEYLYGVVPGGRVDVEEEPGLAERFSIKAVPTILVLVHGEPVGTYSGEMRVGSFVHAVSEMSNTAHRKTLRWREWEGVHRDEL